MWVAFLTFRRREFTSQSKRRTISILETHGHCGVAVWHNDSWVLHVGDAYYLRDELKDYDLPINELAALRADNDQLRRDSLDRLRSLTKSHAGSLTFFGYHDTNELPTAVDGLEIAKARIE